MSRWTDKQKFSTGELQREEDKYKLQQLIDEFNSSFPESEFRKLYADNIIDYPEIIKDEKSSKKFKPIMVNWWDDNKFNHEDFWKL